MTASVIFRSRRHGCQKPSALALNRSAATPSGDWSHDNSERTSSSTISFLSTAIVVAFLISSTTDRGIPASSQQSWSWFTMPETLSVGHNSTKPKP